jgi:hypothetical protein
MLPIIICQCRLKLLSLLRGHSHRRNSFTSLFCYRDSIHTIVGSIHILGMCLINPMKMDAPHYYMSVSSQITLITERSQSSQELIYFSLLLQRLNSYYGGEHPQSWDVYNKFQECGCSRFWYVSTISNSSDFWKNYHTLQELIYFPLCYRDSIHTIVGSILILVRCVINSKHTDAPKYCFVIVISNNSIYWKIYHSLQELI